MKKRLSIVLAALMCVSLLLLAACGGGVEAPASSSTPAASTSTASGSEPGSEATSTGGDGWVVDPAKAEKTLKLTHHDPPQSATGKFLDAWAAQVNEASDGRLYIEVVSGGSLAGPKESLDMMKTGGVDIAWSLQSFYPGLFPMTESMMLPMLGISSAAQGSAAIWDLYTNTDYLKAEYEDYHVLLLHTNCDSPISTTSKKIETVDDIKGLQVRTLAGPPTSFMELLGAQPNDIPIGDVYSSLEKGVIDAVVTDWHAINSFKLYEQLNYYLDAHVQVSPYFLLMNKDSYAALPEDLQKILDDNSGAAALELAGASWDDVQTSVTEIINEKDPEAIYTLSDDETAKLVAAGETTEANWVTEKTEAGYDAQACLDAAKEAIKNAA